MSVPCKSPLMSFVRLSIVLFAWTAFSPPVLLSSLLWHAEISLYAEIQSIMNTARPATEFHTVHCLDPSPILFRIAIWSSTLHVARGLCIGLLSKWRRRSKSKDENNRSGLSIAIGRFEIPVCCTTAFSLSEVTMTLCDAFPRTYPLL